MTYRHFHLFNCTLTAQLSYIFRIGGTGQPPATIWFSQVGKENIFSSCQVLQARCENQPCKPTWSTWYHTGCMGTRAGGFWSTEQEQRTRRLCWGITHSTTNQRGKSLDTRFPRLKQSVLGSHGCEERQWDAKHNFQLVQGCLWDVCNQHNLKQFLCSLKLP